jgi:hypothetical protein
MASLLRAPLRTLHFRVLNASQHFLCCPAPRTDRAGQVPEETAQPNPTGASSKRELAFTHEPQQHCATKMVQESASARSDPESLSSANV